MFGSLLYLPCEKGDGVSDWNSSFAFKTGKLTVYTLSASFSHGLVVEVQDIEGRNFRPNCKCQMKK